MCYIQRTGLHVHFGIYKVCSLKVLSVEETFMLIMCSLHPHFWHVMTAAHNACLILEYLVRLRGELIFAQIGMLIR
jgi:hypothetical protein